MTDRSTDNPEDQPVPLDPDETPAPEGGMAEQETMAEATAMGVGPGEQDEAAEAGDGRAIERAEPVEASATTEAAEVAEAEAPEVAAAEESGDTEGEGEAGGEAASDLDAEELEAAATAAEDDPRADTQILEVDAGSPAVRSGPAERGAPRATAAVRAGGRTAIVVDPALRIRDRASQVFVALTVIVFVAIFANAMLFGVGGALNAAPSPNPSASPASNGSPGPSGSAAPTTTAGPSAS